uniref:Uncharacterized protein n=1 Tax=Panagrolaimus sp. ES5 TaxID=591445 RepID=A0AC34G051_9BILA
MLGGSQMEESNIFVDLVIQQFMELITVYVKCIVTVLSQTSEISVEKVLEGLPPMNENLFLDVSAILYNLFHKKLNYVQRILAMSDAVKMAQYMAHLIAVTYEAIGKYLNVEEVKDFGKLEKYKAMFIRFRQYSVELKLLMEVIKSLAEKFIAHLCETAKPFIDKLKDENSDSGIAEHAVCQFLKNRNVEYQSSLNSLKLYLDLSVLAKVSL